MTDVYKKASNTVCEVIEAHHFKFFLSKTGRFLTQKAKFQNMIGNFVEI